MMKGIRKLFSKLCQLLGALLLISVLAGCNSIASVAPTTISATVTSTPPSVRRIAFYVTSYGFGQSDIYVVNADGSHLTHLAKNAGHPVWSPDNRYVAFISSDGVQMMDADGNNRVQLAYDSDLISNMAWSPNGKQIIFSSTKHDGTGSIYLVNVEESLQGKPDSGPKRLNRQGIDAEGIIWSPDGQQLTFSYRRDLHSLDEIAVLNIEEALQSAEGGEWLDLTEGENPAWSPDGQYIIFESGLGDNQGIYIMDVSGTHPMLLASNAAYPAWSPDGQQIAFVSYPKDNLEIYVMNADGSHQTRLTNNSTVDLYPTWSPDSEQIAFISGKDVLSGNLYVINADGSHLLRLTDSTLPLVPQVPMWAPQ